MIVALSPIFLFNSDKIGGIILQGPHHSAEKSTNTGLDPDMSLSKLFM
jgi:hypothetical protein